MNEQRAARANQSQVRDYLEFCVVPLHRWTYISKVNVWQFNTWEYFMQIETPDIKQPLTPISQEIEEFRAYLEQVMADGKLSRPKVEEINNRIRNAKPIAAEKASLVREFMREKMQQGELELEWDE